MHQSQRRREAGTDGSEQGLDRPTSPCCEERVVSQGRPTFEEKTVHDYSPVSGVIETEVMVRVQGGVCSACGQPLVRYAEPADRWKDWLKERGVS